MAKLNDSQLMILSAASQRQDLSVYPLPKSVKRGDGPKHLKKLLSLQPIEEVEAVGDVPVWRTHEDGYNVTLILADAGFKILGIEREAAEKARKQEKSGQKARTETKNEPSSTSRHDSKQAKMIALLQRPKGTTIDELIQMTGWQRHSVHGVMSGVLRKKLGLNITSETSPQGRTYRIVAAS